MNSFSSVGNNLPHVPLLICICVEFSYWLAHRQVRGQLWGRLWPSHSRTLISVLTHAPYIISDCTCLHAKGPEVILSSLSETAVNIKSSAYVWFSLWGSADGFVSHQSHRRSVQSDDTKAHRWFADWETLDGWVAGSVQALQTQQLHNLWIKKSAVTLQL